MSLDDARRAVNGGVGKTLLGAAVAAILTLSGWTLKTISQHSSTLSTISQQVADLAESVQSHNRETDAALGRLLTDDQAHGEAIAKTQQEIADLEHAPHVIERETVVRDPPRRPVDPPAPIPQIGAAITHLLGIRGRGTHRAQHHSGR